MPMVNQFAQVPTVEFSRNAFVRNHTWKGTIDGGYLYPVFFDEVLPGDTKQLNTTFFGRLATPFVPVLDNIYLDYHLFFVPNRLVWTHWKNFMGERKNPTDSIDYTVPSITADSTNGFTPLGFFDYLSVPPSVPSLTANSLTFYARAYNLIWNEWYRDENLQNSVTVPDGDGPDLESSYPLLKRGKRQDYFTSCLPSPQKGPGASVNLAGSAPVVGNGNAMVLKTYGPGTDPLYCQLSTYPGVSSSAGNATLGYVSSGTAAQQYDSISNPSTKTYFSVKTNASQQTYGVGLSDVSGKSGLQADLSSTTAVTINSLRQAIALQQFLEQDMRGGTRYVELILSHFGVQCPDYRLQRPEYLGGGSSRINISPIAQTSSTDSTTPQGNLAAIGTVGSTGNGFTHSFTEHGVILGLASVRCDLTYQQGIDRHFLRKTRYDYFFPTLAHLGEQTVLNKEIYAQGDAVKDANLDIIDDKAFGYNERYAEYRYKNSYITSEFRSSYSQSLDVWHLAQNFASLPTLNSTFITENPPLSRISAVQSEPALLLDVYHDFTDIREVPMYGTPGLRRI